MLKWKDFSIGGYNFNDWSLVKELYVPTDVSSSTDRSLHMRGREALPHHLQHYVIPNDKRFIVFAITNVLLSTNTGIGLFGTGKGFGRYPESHQQPGDTNPGAPLAWVSEDWPFGQYWCSPGVWGSLVIHGGIIYECKLTHWPDAAKEPGTPGGDAYWVTHNEVWEVDWKENKWYYFNELAMVTVEGVAGAYMCMVDHTSEASNKPCDGSWDDIWNPGDEFTPDLTSQYGFSKKCLNVSKGANKPFGREILAVFDGTTGTYGRRIDAMTSGGTMKAGATLLGIEVDA